MAFLHGTLLEGELYIKQSKREERIKMKKVKSACTAHGGLRRVVYMRLTRLQSAG